MIVHRGLTTVELMVTLFVGALFIISGYQLYGAISMRASDSREMAEASNIGYEVLRKEGTYQSVSSPCSSPIQQNIPRTSPQLPGIEVVLSRCKPIASSSLIRVMVVVKYGSAPKKEVAHATYVAP